MFSVSHWLSKVDICFLYFRLVPPCLTTIFLEQRSLFINRLKREKYELVPYCCDLNVCDSSLQSFQQSLSNDEKTFIIKRSKFREISVSRVLRACIGLIHGYFRDVTAFEKGHAPCFLSPYFSEIPI